MTEPNNPPPGTQPGWTPPGGQTTSSWTAPASQPGGPPPADPSWQYGSGRHRHEGRTGALVGGIILISLGGIFLLDELVPSFDIGRLWPLILIAIGAALLIGAFFRRA
ncbi:MAG: LiaI-LiaF-like domain-containing protein [Candidatus Limnocylindrales bacterium]